MNTKNILKWASITLLAASTGLANDDLDADGITLSMEMGLTSPFERYEPVNFYPTLSRQPQPKNEWEYRDFEVQELNSDDGTDGGQNWSTRNHNKVDTSKSGTFSKTFRAKLAFYKEQTAYTYTPGTTVQYEVLPALR